MPRIIPLAFVAAALAGCTQDTPSPTDSSKASPEVESPTQETIAMSTNSVLDHEAKRITGETESLQTYEGKVVMVVNVASKCGFTGQYEQLESLYDKYKDQGFVVLGFPSNQFGSQEPGSNAEIAEFCRSTYDVSFPMFEKVDVKGENAHPLYKELVSQAEPIGGEPEWNFTKFLIARDGTVARRFDTRTSPDDEKVVSAIEELL